MILSNTVDLSKIKLVIWDLDNTFWNGIISEGGVTENPQNTNLVKQLTEHGIVNSICSKNDFDVCKAELEKIGIWDYFVFPSIDWTAKGNRVHQIIKDMHLRPANVLFLDDELYNLQYASSVDEALMCGHIQDLYASISEQLPGLPINESLKRLKQYQQLQVKVQSKRDFDSDEAFLRSSDIKVAMCKDCMPQIDRITELINRTNQLNFTKNRIDKDAVDRLLADPGYECAYVACRDKFSDYGIVGFYALQKAEHRLEHFLFSCRTIGMGVEQYVYASLGHPSLKVVGDVVNSVDDSPRPDWIQSMDYSVQKEQTSNKSTNTFLVKGPCDVSQIFAFFEGDNNIETEFAYVSTSKPGVYIEGQNHSTQILMSAELSADLKKELIQNVPFIDEEYFDTKIFTKKYDYVIFSMLTDYGLGLYRNKQHPDIVIPLGQYTVDYTKEDDWNWLMHLQSKMSNDEMRQEYVRFSQNYEFVGRISDEMMVQNLEKIREKLPKDTKLILLNGAEAPYSKKCEKPGYDDRDALHRHLNQIVNQFVSKHSDNCVVIDINKCLGNNPYLDTINHYKKSVYYRIALAIQKYVSESSDKGLEVPLKNALYIILKSKYGMFKWRCVQMRDRIKKILGK